MSMVDSRSNNAKIKLGIEFFLIKPPLRSSSSYKVLPSFKKREIRLLKSNSQILKPLSCDFWESFAIQGKGATTAHLPHGFTPT